MDVTDPFGWIGATIDGKFDVEAVAGEGGFGVVYRGRHLGFDEAIAIKCLKIPTGFGSAERSAFLRAFHVEARILLGLSRSTTHIVRPLDFGAATSPNGTWTPYLVMEWLDGETLEADLAERQRQKAPARGVVEAIRLLAPAASAIAVGHAEGVSHRDLKPANLFLARERHGLTLKVLDFGIAKVMQESASATSAVTGAGGLRAFTPQYAAPEQFASTYGATGPWTDVFAMALILIEAASGRVALAGRDALQFFVASCNEKARPSLAACGIVTHQAVERVLGRALDVSPAQRHRTLGELWRELEAACAAPAGTSIPPMSIQETSLAVLSLPGPHAPRLGALVSVLPPSMSPRSELHSRATAAHPTTAPDVVPEENRVCSILSAELGGLRALSERLLPEEVQDAMDPCFQLFAARIQRLGGRIAKLTGEGLTAVFGLPRATDNDAERAVLAAMQMQSGLRGMAFPRRLRGQRPNLRVGIATGRVFAGTTGGTTRRDLSVVGEAVNVAADLQRLAPADAVVIGRDTYRQVSGLFNVEQLAPDAGGGEALAAYRVVGPMSARRPIPSTDFYGAETAFVGRRAELERLVDALETTTSESRAQIVTMVGLSGVGRSRLLGELFGCLATRGEPFVVAVASCSPLTQGTSYRLAASLVRMRFSIHEDDSPDSIRGKLRRGVRWFRASHGARARGEPAYEGDPAERPEADLGDALEQVATILGAKDPATSEDGAIAPDEGWSQAKNRTAAAMARIVDSVTARAPVVLLCDDVQWADDASLDLLDELVLRDAERPLLVVCTARPELYDRRPHWGEGKSSHARIEVGALARRHVEEMARDRLRRAADVPADFVRMLADRAEGNPRALQETLHLLIDSGVIERDPWRIHAARLSTLALPATIQGIVQARLDRLDPEARALVGYASVVGRTFWDGAVDDLRVAASQERDAAEGTARTIVPTSDLLGRLRERQLVRARDASTFPAEREFVFAESATQEVAYETLSLKVRRRLHCRMAAWLAARASGDAGAALVAMHYDRGGDTRRAAAAYARAAARAASLGQNVEARSHFERAVAIHDESEGGGPVASSGTLIAVDLEEVRVAPWRDRVRVRVELGDVLRRIGQLEDAERAYEAARARILRIERRIGEPFDPLEQRCWDARIDFRLALTHRVRGAVDRATALVERAIDAATAGGAVEETAPMWAVLAALHRRARDLAACEAAARRGLRVCRAARRSGVSWRRSVAPPSARDLPITMVAPATPRLAPQPGLAPTPERWREAASHLLGALGGASMSRGRLVRAQRLCRQAVRVLDEKANPQAAAIALNTLAAVAVAMGDFPAARATFVRSLALKEREGDLHELGIAHNNLAEVELALGHAPAALEHARRSVRSLESVAADADLPDALRNLAEALLATRQSSPALEAAARALTLAEAAAGRIYLRDVVLAMGRICAAVLDDPTRDAASREPANDAARRVLALLDAPDWKDGSPPIEALRASLRRANARSG